MKLLTIIIWLNYILLKSKNIARIIFILNIYYELLKDLFEIEIISIHLIENKTWCW